MSAPHPSHVRFVEIAVAVVTIAIPIALIIGSLEPLESPPRAGRPSSVEQAPASDGAVSDPDQVSTEREGRGQQSRRARAENEGEAPTAATPAP